MLELVFERCPDNSIFVWFLFESWSRWGVILLQFCLNDKCSKSRPDVSTHWVHPAQIIPQSWSEERFSPMVKEVEGNVDKCAATTNILQNNISGREIIWYYDKLSSNYIFILTIANIQLGNTNNCLLSPPAVSDSWLLYFSVVDKVVYFKSFL